jgi:hypothetical protein
MDTTRKSFTMEFSLQKFVGVISLALLSKAVMANSIAVTFFFTTEDAEEDRSESTEVIMRAT